MDPSNKFEVNRLHLEVNQFVRLTKKNSKRTEIGVISHIYYKNNNNNNNNNNHYDVNSPAPLLVEDREIDKVIITTRQGYDVEADPSEVKKAFLLVLDLNGVLVARERGFFVVRPHLETFIKFVFQNFVVGVWTSGLERTSIPVIDKVFSSTYKERLLFTFFRDKCDERPTPVNPYGTVKNLQRIFNDYKESFNAVNTIIIDDSPDKCSHPDVALCPLPFVSSYITESDHNVTEEDGGLLKVMAVLQEVLEKDSLEPLIQAAEERLQFLARKGIPIEKLPSKTFQFIEPTTEKKGEELEKIVLWQSRLCCEHLRGVCHRGDDCRYSHDIPKEYDNNNNNSNAKMNYNIPCSKTFRCPYGHAARWVPTSSDEILKQYRKEKNRFRDGAVERHFNPNNNNNRHEDDNNNKKAPPPQAPILVPRTKEEYEREFYKGSYENNNNTNATEISDSRFDLSKLNKKFGADHSITIEEEYNNNNNYNYNSGRREKEPPFMTSSTGNPRLDLQMHQQQQQQQSSTTAGPSSSSSTSPYFNHHHRHNNNNNYDDGRSEQKNNVLDGLVIGRDSNDSKRTSPPYHNDNYNHNNNNHKGNNRKQNNNHNNNNQQPQVISLSGNEGDGLALVKQLEILMKH